jgi:hypothetical protein
VIVVDAHVLGDGEADPVDVEVLGPIHVGDGNRDHLKPEVHCG